ASRSGRPVSPYRVSSELVCERLIPETGDPLEPLHRANRELPERSGSELPRGVPIPSTRPLSEDDPVATRCHVRVRKCLFGPQRKKRRVCAVAELIPKTPRAEAAMQPIDVAPGARPAPVEI